MAASHSSADRPPTRRQIEARTRRRLREADALEADMVASLLGQLADLQTEIRQTVSDNAGAPFTTALEAVDLRIAARTAAMLTTAGEAITAATGQGVEIIDDIVAMGRLGLRLPPADTAASVTQITGYARLLIARATDLVRLATVSQLALLAGGRQDLTATLEAIGTTPRGTKVFGRAAERLAGATTALTGEAYGAAQQIRADQVQQALSTTGPAREATATKPRPALLKRWISSHKSDARDSHADAEARYGPGGSVGPIPYGDDFRVGSWTTPYPRGPGLPGAQKVHCRCRCAPVLGIDQSRSRLLDLLNQPPAAPTPPATATSGAGGAGRPPNLPTAGAGDPGDPMDFIDAMLQWTEGSTHPAVRDAIRRMTAGHPLGDSDAERAARRIMDEFLDNAEPMPSTIWHGEPIADEIQEILDRYEVGTTFTIALSGFSHSWDVAKVFSHGLVVFEVEPGALGLDITNSSLFPSEQEVLAGGSFIVTGTSRSQDGVELIIRIRQVNR